MIARYDFGTPEYVEALALRDEVLRRPLGMSINNDDLSEEWSQLHLAPGATAGS